MRTKRSIGQLQLGLAVSTIQRCVSMARVEVFVPAELMDLPECLEKGFGGKLRDLDAQVNTVSIYAVDLHRDLSREETAALEIAWQQYGAWHRIFRR